MYVNLTSPGQNVQIDLRKYGTCGPDLPLHCQGCGGPRLGSGTLLGRGSCFSCGSPRYGTIESDYAPSRTIRRARLKKCLMA